MTLEGIVPQKSLGRQPLGRQFSFQHFAQYIGLAASTLAKKRLQGDGPPFIKAGPRIILYDVLDVDAWLAKRRRHSTADTGDEAA